MGAGAGKQEAPTFVNCRWGSGVLQPTIFRAAGEKWPPLASHSPCLVLGGWSGAPPQTPLPNLCPVQAEL